MNAFGEGIEPYFFNGLQVFDALINIALIGVREGRRDSPCSLDDWSPPPSVHCRASRRVCAGPWCRHSGTTPQTIVRNCSSSEFPRIQFLS